MNQIIDILKIAKIASVWVLLSASAILFVGVVAYAQDKSKLKLEMANQANLKLIISILESY